MQIKTKKSFNDLLKNLTLEVIDEEGDYCPPEEDEELDEITVTGDIDGYNTPFAFTGKKGNKKKKKQVATNSTGFKPVNEALDEKDFKQIKKLIRDVVGDILRDIWLKRTAWK